MRIAICDDDQRELERLTALLINYRANKKIELSFHVFKSGTELLFDFKGDEYDLIILDILMPGIDGIQTTKEIRQMDKEAKIILLTSSPEFALESYSVGAYYYLLKPATDKTLFPLLDKAYIELSAQEEDSLLIRDREGVIRVHFTWIEYVEVMNKNVSFHLTDGSVRECFGSLSDFEDELLSQTGFLKIHRSFLINLKHIQFLNAKGVRTRSGHAIPISRKMYPQIKEAYMQYLFQPAEASPASYANSAASGSITQEKGPYRLLFVDDEPDQLTYWAEILRAKGCVVHTALCAEDALHLASAIACDCILLDVMLPDENGFSLCHKLKKVTKAPVVFLSCHTDSENQLSGFQAGGIDYISKDTPSQLFWAKIEARIRLTNPIRTELQFGPLILNLSQHSVFLNEQELSLTSTEFDLLCLLSQNPDQVYTPEELYQMVWGAEQWDGGHAIQVHMSRLRRKLDAAYPRHVFIETVWGQGYRFIPAKLS